MSQLPDSVECLIRNLCRATTLGEFRQLQAEAIDIAEDHGIQTAPKAFDENGSSTGMSLGELLGTNAFIRRANVHFG